MKIAFPALLRAHLIDVPYFRIYLDIALENQNFKFCDEVMELPERSLEEILGDVHEVKIEPNLRAR